MERPHATNPRNASATDVPSTSDDDLSAQSRAAGILLVIFAAIMGLSMVLRRRPDAIGCVAQGVISAIADWRVWAVVGPLVWLVCFVALLFMRRR